MNIAVDFSSSFPRRNWQQILNNVNLTESNSTSDFREGDLDNENWIHLYNKTRHCSHKHPPACKPLVHPSLVLEVFCYDFCDDIKQDVII
jgi:hypothetical protein